MFNFCGCFYPKSDPKAELKIIDEQAELRQHVQNLREAFNRLNNAQETIVYENMLLYNHAIKELECMEKAEKAEEIEVMTKIKTFAMANKVYIKKVQKLQQSIENGCHTRVYTNRAYTETCNIKIIR
jgi:hypothetical protein